MFPQIRKSTTRWNATSPRTWQNPLKISVAAENLGTPDDNNNTREAHISQELTVHKNNKEF